MLLEKNSPKSHALIYKSFSIGIVHFFSKESIDLISFESPNYISISPIFSFGICYISRGARKLGGHHDYKKNHQIFSQNI